VGLPKQSLAAELLVADANVEDDRGSESDCGGVPGMSTKSCSFGGFILELAIALEACGSDAMGSRFVCSATVSAMAPISDKTIPAASADMNWGTILLDFLPVSHA
jgi:hypothetical protein